MDDALKSSKRKDWETPKWLFDHFNKIFKFDLDVCATKETAKCKNFYTPEEDAFKQPWRGVIWMNPPYGQNTINPWLKRAHDEAIAGNCIVVALVPARTDTSWFHDYCCKFAITFIRRRVRFVGGDYCATFPSCVVVFSKDYSPKIEFVDYGINGSKLDNILK